MNSEHPQFFEWFGQQITEDEFLRARTHNRYRWIITWMASVPVFFAGLAFAVLGPFGMIVDMMMIGAVLPGIYSLATLVFPASKIYGSTIYQKYEGYRERQMCLRDQSEGGA